MLVVSARLLLDFRCRVG